MLRPTPGYVLANLRVLANTSPEFGNFIAWLQAEREDAVRTLSSARDQWSAAQHGGCVRTLDHVLDAIEASKR